MLFCKFFLPSYLHGAFVEWGVWDNFTIDHLANALRLDSLQSSHPIQVPIHHAEEVEQVFDAISYSKGGSVIRMIRAVLGMKNFQSGLAAYMKKHQYSNTETIDLWQAWEESSGLPVQELMASWTEQMGYPLLRVTKETWEDSKVTLELDQMWFLSDGSDLPEGGADKKWTVPIITCTEEGTQEEIVYMREKTATITIPIPKGGWAKLNAGQECVLRVLPTDEMLSRLSAGVKSMKLPAPDRAGLVNDAYALVKAGHMKAETLIKLLASYEKEESQVVWEGLAGALTGLDAVMADDEKMSNNFRKFAKKIIAHCASKIGWEFLPSDKHQTSLLRTLIVGLLSRFSFDEPDVANEASTRFKAFEEDYHDMKSLPSDIRVPGALVYTYMFSPNNVKMIINIFSNHSFLVCCFFPPLVFKIVLKNGGEAEYNSIKAYYDKAEDNAEKKHVLNSLGATPDPALKLAAMEWSCSGEIKIQDFFYLMGSVGRSNHEGHNISWNYYKDNMKKIQKMLGASSPSLMNACIVMCAGGFCTREKADEIEEFFKVHPLPLCTRRIAQLLETIRANAKFMDILQASDLSKDEFWASL